MLCQLQHPRICQLVGFIQTSKRKCAIVKDFMSKDLRRLIETRMRKKSMNARGQACVSFDLSDSLNIMLQIALGMQFIHAIGMTHSGLKPDNLLAEERGGRIEVKIADFGVSHHIDSTERRKGAVDSGFYKAPDFLLLPASPKGVEGNFDLKASDVYSFAMTCYAIFRGKEPYLSKDHQIVIQENTSGRLTLTLPPDLNPSLEALTEKCWHIQPERRGEFTSSCQ